LKKYNIIDLYVIEKNNHKFICEYLLENEYIEVLTREKIRIDNKVKIERLVKYCSILEKICLDSKKPLRLTKKDILLKYLEINEKTIDKKFDLPYRVIPFDKDLTEEQKQNIMIDMWRTYVESKKDEIPDIQIMNSKELQKIKKQRW